MYHLGCISTTCWKGCAESPLEKEEADPRTGDGRVGERKRQSLAESVCFLRAGRYN